MECTRSDELWQGPAKYDGEELTIQCDKDYALVGFEISTNVQVIYVEIHISGKLKNGVNFNQTGNQVKFPKPIAVHHKQPLWLHIWANK